MIQLTLTAIFLRRFSSCKSRLGKPFKTCVGHLSLVLKFVRIVSEEELGGRLEQPFTSVSAARPDHIGLLWGPSVLVLILYPFLPDLTNVYNDI